MRYVREEVVSLKPVYYQFGLELGVPPSELDTVKVTYNQNLDQALTEVLKLWLRRCSTVEPTWQSLVKAVESPSGGSNYRLAVGIASRHR